MFNNEERIMLKIISKLLRQLADDVDEGKFECDEE